MIYSADFASANDDRVLITLVILTHIHGPCCVLHCYERLLSNGCLVLCQASNIRQHEQTRSNCLTLL